MTRAELDAIRDRAYVLRCAIEDVERDLAERADDPDNLERAFAWLLTAAREATVADSRQS